MAENRMECEEGKRFVKINFFPGKNRGASAELMAQEAEQSLRRAFSGKLVDNPPKSGKVKTFI